MDNRVGILVDVKETMSTVAPSMTSSMRDVSSAAEEMKGALDMGDMLSQYEKVSGSLNDFSRTIEQINRKYEQMEQKRRGAGGGVGARGGAGQAPIVQASEMATGITQQVGAQDVMGAVTKTVQSMGAALENILAIGDIAKAVAAPLILIDAITSNYQRQLPIVTELTSQLDRLGGSVEDMDMSINTTMQEISDAGAEYGYRLQESTRMVQNLLQAGGWQGAAVPGARQIMGYARVGYAPPEVMARYLGMAQRFGIGGDVLGMAFGAAQQTGVGPARYNEFLNATLSIFEEGISRGVVKGNEILENQMWMARGGEIFKGQAGLNVYKRMESAFAGAAGLQTEQDVIMFRAAKTLLEGMSEEKRKAIGIEGPLSALDVKKYLEQGMTGPLFNQVQDMLAGMSSSYEDLIRLTRSQYGWQSWTMAERVAGLRGEEGALYIKGAPMVQEIPGFKIARAEEESAQAIREMGYTLLDVKETIVGSARDIINAIRDLVAPRKKVEATTGSPVLDFLMDISGGGGTARQLLGEIETRRAEEQATAQAESLEVLKQIRDANMKLFKTMDEGYTVEMQE